MCLGFLEEPQEAGVGGGSYARDKDTGERRADREDPQAIIMVLAFTE